MRYERKKDWVEIQGAADRPMKQLMMVDADSIEAAHKLAVELTPEGHFEDQQGVEVDWRGDIFALSVRQWAWWKAKIWQAARDEKIDPEA
jgi:hypothetical protein